MVGAEIRGKGSLLIAEDEAGVRENLAEVLREEGYQVTEAVDGAEAIAALNTQEFDLVLSDLRMPNADGIAVLQHIRQAAPQTLVLLTTAHATVETAVEALRRGAQDYLVKPLLIEDVLHKIEYLLENRQLAWENQFLRRQAERQWDLDGFVGRSAAMQAVMQLARRVAPTPSTVLITGESGVGKEVVARAIHHFGEQRDRIFLPVNCGAIPEKLIESQLFGHLRGSFTGAISNQEGLFHRARGGTIFLDEIGDLPLNLQVKLLRAIEAKEILPLGASTPVTVEVRVIAATNRDLLREVEADRFRDDLYYRLSVVRIDIPPLRERREAIPALIDHFIQMHNRELKKHVKGADSATVKLLMAQPWRGNIRELDNVIEHAMIVGDGDWITPHDLPRPIQQDTDLPAPTGDNLRAALRAFEKVHIQGVLTKVHHDKKAAARQLGVSLASLYRKIDELQLSAHEPKP